MFEFIIEKLKPEHDVYFIDQIMSKYGDIESITYINNEKSVLLIYSCLYKKMRRIYDDLNILETIAFYYDDESNESWDISRKQINDDRLLEEIGYVRKEKEMLEYKLYVKDEKIQELEAMLQKLKDEHNTAMIMLKDMSKLLNK